MWRVELILSLIGLVVVIGVGWALVSETWRWLAWRGATVHDMRMAHLYGGQRLQGHRGSRE